MLGIVLSSDTGDLDLSTGRMQLGQVQAQTASFLLLGSPGTFGEWPRLGLRAYRKLGGQPDPMFPTEAAKQMRFCLLPVDRVSLTNDGYLISFTD
ncbi:hypothetical protein [uncultured Porphyromonas sp.]|uniref:hypothetical protein n=1 Tax=uncultured Porphyromonas sp. TaxID=159274 RepID=UPI002618E126|nr:hypothetical protein [uncultured Porphyromonas sp.]